MSDKKFIDRPKKPRKGEKLDISKLAPYLKDQLPQLSGDMDVEQFPKGFSNLTYMLKVGDTELVLRRAPFGANIKGGHDMLREYRVQSALKPIYGKVPNVLHYCEDDSILGADFYVMERVRGVILRANMREEMQPSPPLMTQIAESLVNELAALHAVDLEEAGLTDFGKPEGYVERQIRGWTKRYDKAKTDDVPTMHAAAKWLAENMPAMSGTTLVHNDFKYDNFVLNPDDWSEITAVLDWEMATIGDPLMDLGTSISYWVQADDPPIMAALNLSPTTLPGNLTRREVVDRYAQASGRNVANIVYYYVYGLFKLGVIVQQIYYRYVNGYTNDPRFAALIHAVKSCGGMAVQAIEKNEI